MNSENTAFRDTPLHYRLRHFRCLLEEDFHSLDKLLEKKSSAAAGVFLLEEGTKYDNVIVITKGWAIRYKSLPDGRRQILNVLVPGDLYGLFSPLFEYTEYGVEALTAVETLSFPSLKMLEVFQSTPRLALALTWLAGLDDRQLDEQILRIGKRRAFERMAHLFLELHRRQLLVGINDSDARLLPFTQPILADTLGMSHVHANRSFRNLIDNDLVAWNDRRIQLLDIAGLAELANFNASYLEQLEVPAKTRAATLAMDS